MAVATVVNEVLTSIKKARCSIKKDSGPTVLSNFKDTEAKLRSIRALAEQDVRDVATHIRVEELECGLLGLSDILSEMQGLHCDVYANTLETNLHKEVESLKEELKRVTDELKRVTDQCGRLQLEMEGLKEEKQRRQREDDCLMVGQLCTEIENAIITKFLPQKGRTRYRIYDIKAFYKVLKDQDFRNKVFENNQDAMREMRRNWEDIRLMLNIDDDRLKQLIKYFKDPRNRIAHPTFDLEQARTILQQRYEGCDREDGEELCEIYEKLKELS